MLGRFAALVSHWVRASALPIDQLLLTIAQELFTREADLAICHTLATSLGADRPDTSRVAPARLCRGAGSGGPQPARHQWALAGGCGLYAHRRGTSW